MARRGGGGGGGDGSGWSEETTYIVCGVIGGIFVLYMIYLCYRSNKRKSAAAAASAQSAAAGPVTGTAGSATIISVQNPNQSLTSQTQPLLTNYYAGPTSQGPLPPQPAPNNGGPYPGYAPPVGTPVVGGGGGMAYGQPASPYGNPTALPMQTAAPYPGMMPSPHAGGYAPLPTPGPSQPYQY
ncbi:hypothetical protein EC968_006098 [Mortierella alpina]|nr:hypothetical protein EC968_006098 [Mortierella alpina]